MEDLIRGRSFRRVARPVVRGGKFVPAPAPTHHHPEMGRTARENTQKVRNVKCDHAKVRRINNFDLIGSTSICCSFNLSLC